MATKKVRVVEDEDGNPAMTDVSDTDLSYELTDLRSEIESGFADALSAARSSVERIADRSVARGDAARFRQLAFDIINQVQDDLRRVIARVDVTSGKAASRHETKGLDVLRNRLAEAERLWGEFVRWADSIRDEYDAANRANTGNTVDSALAVYEEDFGLAAGNPDADLAATIAGYRRVMEREMSGDKAAKPAEEADENGDHEKPDEGDEIEPAKKPKRGKKGDAYLAAKSVGAHGLYR